MKWLAFVLLLTWAERAYSQQVTLDECIRLHRAIPSFGSRDVLHSIIARVDDFYAACASLSNRGLVAVNLIRKADALSELRRYDEALRVARLAESIEPYSGSALTFAEIFSATGRFDEAIAAYQEAGRRVQRQIEHESLKLSTIKIPEMRLVTIDLIKALKHRLDSIPRFIAALEDAQRRSKPSSGTGFVINNRGDILTNHHVVGNCARLELRLLSDTPSPLRLIASDPRSDLAVVRTSLTSLPPLAFRTERAQPGEPVVVFGFPLAGLIAADGAVTTGIVNSTVGLRGDNQQLQISAPVQPGNSGGAVLDQGGAVVGVVVSKLNAMAVAGATGDVPQNVNFAIKAEVARLFLGLNDIPHSMTSQSRTLDTVAVTQRARSSSVQIHCLK